MIGQKLSSRYEILREVGRGGMGVVYLARDPILDREVAIKVLTTGALSGDQNERFEREARAIAKLDHPGIVQIYDFARYEGTPFFVMPFIPGQTLRALQKEGMLKPWEVLEIGAEVADALGYSHQRGIVHRDIKPENIMTVKEGEEWRAKLMDFGIALGPKDERMTRSDIIVGTLAYLPPESVIDSASSPAGDIYSLGVVLYEALSGRLPFSGDTQTMLYKIVHSDPEQPGLIASLVDLDTENIVLACLAKSPTARPRNGGELGAALRDLAKNLKSPGQTGGLSATLGAVSSRSRLVGREREFEDLGKAFHRAQAGEAQLALVSGDHGFGKGALLNELERAARSRGALVLHGRFVERTDPALPYQGFSEAFHEYVRAQEAGAVHALSDLLPELSALFPDLREASSVPSSAAPPVDRAAVFDLLARSVGKLAQDQPLMLTFDDLHFADVSLDAIQYVFRRRSSSRLLIATAFVPEAAEEGGAMGRLQSAVRGDPRALLLHLRPLSAENCREIARAFLGEARVPDSAGEALLSATGGNPYFVSELARSLAPEGKFEAFLAGDAEARLSGVAIPSSVQKLADERIASLSETDRAVLQCASVIGPSFTPDEIAAVTGLAARAERAIETLIERDLLREDESSGAARLVFTSVLLREASGRTLHQVRRRSMHKAYAEFLETKFARRLDRVTPALIRHFTAAGLVDRAAPHALQAAKGALAASSFDDAQRYARSVIEAAASPDWFDDGSLEASARLVAAQAAQGAGEFEHAASLGEEAARGFSAVTDHENRARALLVAAESSLSALKLDQAKLLAGEGQSLVAAHKLDGLKEGFEAVLAEVQGSRGPRTTTAIVLPSPTPTGPSPRPAAPKASGLLVAEAEYLAAEEAAGLSDGGSAEPTDETALKLIHLADLALRVGRLQRGADAAARALQLVDPDDVLTRVSLGVLHGALLLRLGRPKDALFQADTAAEVARRSPDSVPRVIAIQVADLRAQSHLFLGDLADAKAALEEAGVRASPDAEAPARVLLTMAEILTSQGDVATSVRIVDQVLATAQAGQDPALLGAALEARARLLLRAHRPDEALAEAKRGLALADDIGEAGITAGLRLLEGRALLAIGDVGGAEVEFLTANREAEATGARLLTLRAQLGLSATSLVRGRYEAAEISARVALQFSGVAGVRILEARAEHALARVLAATGNLHDASHSLERAREIAVACGDAALQVDALLDLAAQAFGNRDFDTARLRGMEAWNEAAERGDSVRRGHAMIGLARVDLAQGRPADGLAKLASVAAAARADAPRFALAASEALVDARLAVGDTVAAVQEAESAREIAEQIPGALAAVVAAQLAVARARRASGDDGALRQIIQRTLALAEGGDRILQARTGVECARLATEADPDLARSLAENALQRARESDAFTLQAAAAAELAQIHLRAGRLKEARESSDVEEAALADAGLSRGSLRHRMRRARILEIAGDLKGCADLVESETAPNDDVALAVRFLAFRARIKVTQGRLRHATEDADAAVRRAQGAAPRDLLAAHLERARCALAAANPAEAREHLAAIESRFTAATAFERAVADLTRAGAALLEKDGDNAARLAEAACTLFERHFNDVWAATARLLLARALAFQKNAAADRAAGLVETLATSRGWTLLRAEALCVRGKVAGDTDKLKAAADVARRLGSPWVLASVALSRRDAFLSRNQKMEAESDDKTFLGNMSLIAGGLSPDQRAAVTAAIAGGTHPFA